MSTRNWAGMPCALARSSVLTTTPSSVVANCTMARTAYSALADIRMPDTLVAAGGAVSPGQRAHRHRHRRGGVAVRRGQGGAIAHRHRHDPRPAACGDVVLGV